MDTNFVQRINGQVYDRDEYIPHVREMRQMVNGGGELRVLERQPGSRAATYSGWYRQTDLPSLLNPICSRGSKRAKSIA